MAYTFAVEDRALICGFLFTPLGQGRAIELGEALQWLAKSPSETPGEFIWLHFNLTDTASEKWMQSHLDLPPEFFDAFTADDRDNSRFFAGGKGDRMLFDLPGFGLHCLRQTGIGHAEWTRHCTYSDPDRFYSFRRTTRQGEADYGRLISAIRL